MNEETNEQFSNFKPSMLPVKCVLCSGFGSFSHGAKMCNGCQGKGYILVPAVETKERTEKNDK